MPPARRAETALLDRYACPVGLSLRCSTWWSRGDSNPLPPPCKGGALPVELRPQVVRAAPIRRSELWWAILDSNQGPQSYQDCALTT